MIPLPAISLKAAWRIGLLVILALLIAWALRLDHLRAGWKERFGVLTDQAGQVVLALEHATGEAAEWETAPGQVVALGDAVRQRDEAIRVNNQRIDDMAAEAVRLRAKAAELKAIADRAEAQRRSALKRLSDMAITPGTRADCLTLLQEAETALNLVREAGA